MQGMEPHGAVGVFPDQARAHDALERLAQAGVDMRTVSILGHGEADDGSLPPEVDHGPEHRREVAAFWGKWGAATGMAVGIGAIGIPLLAFLVGAGPWGLMLGAAAGAAALSGGAGGLVGALAGAGVHEAHARAYEKALRERKLIVVVHTGKPDLVRDAGSILKQAGAERVDLHGSQ